MARAKEESKNIVTPLDASEKPPKKENKAKAENCWNCANQGEKNPLNAKGSCEVCGFRKNLLYNGEIEADKAAERQAAAETAFNKNVVRG